MNDRIGRNRVSLRILCCNLTVAALAYGCGGGSDSSTGPGGVRGIRVVSGGGLTDTAYTILSQPLVVEVRDSMALIARGRIVQFRELFGAPPNIPAAVQVSRVGQDVWTIDATDETDAQGRAKMRVRFLGRAGTAFLEVSVPDLGLIDTVTYTVKVGTPTRLDFVPRDTTIASGGSYTLRVWNADQGDNWTPCANPTFSASGVSISPTGQVTGTAAITRAPLRVTCSGLTDSTYVSVLP